MPRSVSNRAPVVTQPLLPNEPRVLDLPLQQELTERFLLPAQGALEALLLGCRTRLDPELQRQQPEKGGKPYPLSQCLEISVAVQETLANQDPSTLQGEAAEGFAALAAFIRHGGSARQVWGDLRGQYFQNAFLMGTLYVDAANDTVVPTKPKVEILPFAASGFGPIKDFEHYAAISRRYWGAHVFPNHLLPELAPWFPLLVATPGGSVRLDADSGYMHELARRDAFFSSEAVLAIPALAADLFALLRATLQDVADAMYLPACAEQGRDRALDVCRRQRAAERVDSDPGRATRIALLRAVNARLATLRVSAQTA